MSNWNRGYGNLGIGGEIGGREVRPARDGAIDRILARWAHRKFKSLRRHERRTHSWLERVVHTSGSAIQELAVKWRSSRWVEMWVVVSERDEVELDFSGEMVKATR